MIDLAVSPRKLVAIALKYDGATERMLARFLSALSAVVHHASFSACCAAVLLMTPHLLADASAQTGGFQIQNQYITGLSSPTAMAFTPDGRIFVTEQAGSIRVISVAGQLLSTPFLTLPSVRSDEERGLLGIALDPLFASNGYVYIFYSPGNAAVSRLSRVTANGDRAVANSEVTIFEYDNFSGNHRGGDVHFGPDGLLYLGLGDAGEPENSQSVTSFDGKIVRLNKDGSIPATNPTSFTTTSGATVTTTGAFRAIWAIGLRNPYRFSFHDGTGAMRINDVGAGAFEEVNVGQAGANYGWPTCEGLCSNSFARNPIYTHVRGPDPDQGCAITGGTFERGDRFPAEYTDRYFVIDYCSTWLRHLRVDDSFVTFPLAIPQFSVDLKFAPDGSLLILGHGAGSIARITYTGSGQNRNPVATGTATPTAGPAPLGVAFSAAGSSDPDGDPLTFAWAFGDGGTASGISTNHTYASVGSYTATVTVSDGRGGSAVKSFAISVGIPPTAIISQPAAGTLYSAGDTVAFSGTATDASGDDASRQCVQLDRPVPSRRPYPPRARTAERRPIRIVHDSPHRPPRADGLLPDLSDGDRRIGNPDAGHQGRHAANGAGDDCHQRGRSADPPRRPAAGRPSYLHERRRGAADHRRVVAPIDCRPDLRVRSMVGRWRAKPRHHRAVDQPDLHGDPDHGPAA